FSGTLPALGDCVFPAVEEEQGTLFRTKNLRSSAIEVDNTISRENDGIVFRDRLGARSAGPGLLHAATPQRRHSITAPVRNPAPPTPPAASRARYRHSASTALWPLAHGQPEGMERGLGLTHRHIPRVPYF